MAVLAVLAALGMIGLIVYTSRLVWMVGDKPVKKTFPSASAAHTGLADVNVEKQTAPSHDVIELPGTKSTCWQEWGRACTADEKVTPVLRLRPGAVRELTLHDIPHQHFAVHFDRQNIYNPALVLHSGRLHLVARFEGRNQSWTRCPNRSLTEVVPCPWLPSPRLRMISFVVRVPLNANLEPLGRLECLPYPLDWSNVVAKAPPQRELGPEDPRLFSWGTHGTYMAVNGPPLDKCALGPCPTTSSIRCMKVQRVFPDLGPPVDLRLISVNMTRIEKNWSPLMLAADGGYLFSQQVEPHIVLNCNITGHCTPAATSSALAFFAALRRVWDLTAIHLGTNAVRLPSGLYVAVFHGLSNTAGREYLNFVYAIAPTPPWRIVAVAQQPLALSRGSQSAGFVFSSTLTWVDGMLVIGYNVKDKTSTFAVLSPSIFLANMTAVLPDEDFARPGSPS